MPFAQSLSGTVPADLPAAGLCARAASQAWLWWWDASPAAAALHRW
ncbi:hypothetical protein IC614_08230 [Allosphingosinicella flava]|uniref:Uncharacterized protein n=1 Tax=Allosphingosinicella flava TaxID=2771430 RepID=A0A7T2LLB4_9SPHN|nr:hypothetical protein [Sphingosinicella flava]QPQ54340.1 hypothetical protein IC614_08230 [Sphingosinicella flava]